MARRERAPDAPLPIDAFGDGGFRIAGRRHEGSILLFAGEVHPWPRGDAAGPKDVAAADLSLFLDAADRPDVLVLGVGPAMRHPATELRKALREAGIGLEVADTPAACRLYNLIAGESRRVGAALMAV
ncbi:hypothetical protein E5163_12250 [Marinicauda algicola]|uniref:Mth938-like domain-containing protein n=1 Tax=Marinicauda algicola TaxID=2029849 RepID=A0A4S2GZJ0_9PROT|nr:Mth938-like domain-containing protein [Marinicauda algicola]TGY88576.1 hypothetical protein E5163_12250 [Marinicauda algicola]